jgi:hypothetical protein
MIILFNVWQKGRWDIRQVLNFTSFKKNQQWKLLEWKKEHKEPQSWTWIWSYYGNITTKIVLLILWFAEDISIFRIWK